MASAMRDAGSHLDFQELLARNPWEIGFYEAVRRIECLCPELPRTGYSRLPKEDPLRLCQTPTLKFAPSTVSGYKVDGQGKHRLEVYFLGLLGPNGSMPLHVSEYVLNRLRHAKDPVMMEFFNLFHHRALSLFYRAWAAKEPTVQYDRPESDRFGMYVGALGGYGTPAQRGRDAMPDLTKLHFTAHLGCHARHADGLTSILSAFFGVPARISEFVGEWLDIPEDEYCFLSPNGTANRLGVSSVIGQRSRQCQQKFYIHLGPLSLENYESMLPGGANLERLIAILKNYVGVELDWDLNLILAKDDVPDVQPGQYGKLGWTTWLRTSKRAEDADDLLMNSGPLMAA